MRIFDLARQISLINSSASTLSWDQETYLPPAAAQYRAQQLSYLAAHAHSLATSTEYENALSEAEEKDGQSNPTHSANLRELRRKFNRSTKIPTDFVARESSAESAAHHAWIAARKASDFYIFAPHLDTLFDFARQKADLWGYENEPYDALLESYEPGTSTFAITSLLDSLLEQLKPIAAQAVSISAENSPSIPEGPYPVPKQQSFNTIVATALGFDFQAGRVDTTAHPFCTTLGPRDIRLTTRYDESDFTSSLFGVMHEAGHGLYEQGLPESDFGLPSGSAVSLGVHESQSRLWENQIGRSSAFWQKFYPIAIDHFPQLKSFPLDTFLQYIHRAEFSPIRVEADESTYDLHIIIRFTIERLLLNKQIKPCDVPATWNELFENSFGFRPKSDAEGCLQDIHWSMGGIGYFPTYTLGNINAAQLFAAANSIPHIASATSSANYIPLLTWLRQNIHQHGSSFSPPNLIENATSKSQNTLDYLTHLKSRYLPSLITYNK